MPTQWDEDFLDDDISRRDPVVAALSSRHSFGGDIEDELRNALDRHAHGSIGDLTVYEDSVYVATTNREVMASIQEVLEDSGYGATEVVEDPVEGFGIWAYLPVQAI